MSLKAMHKEGISREKKKNASLLQLKTQGNKHTKSFSASSSKHLITLPPLKTTQSSNIEVRLYHLHKQQKSSSSGTERYGNFLRKNHIYFTKKFKFPAQNKGKGKTMIGGQSYFPI
jgi:acyl-CoA-binding protein